jgi:ribosomal protein S6--L-glutamate ligase
MDRGLRPVMWWDHPLGPCVATEPSLILIRSSKAPQLDRAAAYVARGLATVNALEPHRAATDKAHQAAVFAGAGLAHPTTYTARPAVLPPGPVVRKPRRGAGGVGVELLDVFPDVVGDEFLVQSFVRTVEDYRVTVVGGRAVSWAKRTPLEGEFRSNLKQGATMEEAEPPSTEAHDLALAAVAALDLDVAGVDLIISDAGPCIIEVNAATTLFGPSVAATAATIGAVADLVYDRVSAKEQM